MDTSEKIELMEDRALAYEFLSRAYRTAPDEAFMRALRLGANIQSEGAPMEAFYAELGDAEDDEQLRIDVAAEYNRLFLGMSAHPIPPYESVYTSEEGLLMQDARDEVLAAYRAAGLDVPDDYDLPEDHLAMELAFMAHLARRAQAALEENDRAAAHEAIVQQRAFVDEHLSCWCPAFCDEVQARTSSTFFRDLASLTRAQVDADRELLAELA